MQLLLYSEVHQIFKIGLKISLLERQITIQLVNAKYTLDSTMPLTHSNQKLTPYSQNTEQNTHMLLSMFQVTV